MNGYIAFFNGQQREIYAPDLYSAKKAAVSQMRVPLSKLGLLAVVLAEKNGSAVELNPAAL